MSVVEDASAVAIRAAVEANKDDLTALRNIAAPGWVSEPGYRGTMSILLSCIFTITACVYTALHLNVPPAGRRSAWAQFLKKVEWVVVGILCPEFVLLNAMDELACAYCLKYALQKVQQDTQKSRKDFEFTLAYAFFVIMGGVEVSVDGIVPPNPARREARDRSSGEETLFIPPSDKISDGPCWTLSPLGMLGLAMEGHFFYLPKDRLSDRSKASIVQKAFVIGEVLWMATQCVVRTVNKLPLTLLEIHTFIHVVCAVLIYSFWWKKPHDVTTQEEFRSTNLEYAVALGVQGSECPPSINGRLMIYSRALDVDHRRSRHHSHDYSSRHSRDYNSSHDGDLILRPGHGLPFGVEIEGGEDRLRIRVLPEDELRLERFVAAVNRRARRRGTLHHEPKFFPRGLYHHWFNHASRNILAKDFHIPTELAPDLPWLAALLVGVVRNGFAWVMTFLSIIYGGFHLFAWGFVFPTEEERLFWKIACCLTMAMTPLGMLCLGLIQNSNKPGYLLRFVCTTGLVLSLCTAICARGYIFVEAFIGLRRVPIGVYWTPSWLQMIPHL